MRGGKGGMLLFETILRADAGQTRKDRAILRVIETTPWTPEIIPLFLEQIVRIVDTCPNDRTRLRAAILILDLIDPVEETMAQESKVPSAHRRTTAAQRSAHSPLGTSVSFLSIFQAVLETDMETRPVRTSEAEGEASEDLHDDDRPHDGLNGPLTRSASHATLRSRTHSACDQRCSGRARHRPVWPGHHASA